MSFSFLDNLSDISWNQDNNSHGDLDHNPTLSSMFVSPEHLSALVNYKDSKLFFIISTTLKPLIRHI